MKRIIFLLAIGLGSLKAQSLELSAKKDYPLIIAALPLQFYIHHRFQELKPVSNRGTPPDDLPLFGNWSLQQYSSTMQKSSDYTVEGLIVTPLVFSIYSAWSLNDKSIFLTDAVIFIEALAYSSMLNLAIRSYALRPRPLVYNPDAPENQRSHGEASSSFYSGHASAAFLSATFGVYLFNHHFPGSPALPWVAGSLYSSAVFVAYARMAGGNHYFSDVVMGAFVGSALGYLFPRFHLKNPRSLGFYPVFSPESVALHYNF